jgi:two-component system chemotaxis sensor kinase CheA
LDLEAVRRAAARRGLLDNEPGRFNAEDLIRLLLRGGISTSTAVTEMSGRGVGLDIVRDALKRLGGDVAVRTEPGQGTTFELVVPLSLLSLEALVVEAGRNTVTIPLDAVRSAMRVAADQISTASTGASILYEQKAIPFIFLPRILCGEGTPAGRAWSAVIVAGAAGIAAVGVDCLRGTARIVMRPLPELAPASAIVAGASLNAEGDPQLVLDPDGLVAEALRGDTASLEETVAPRPVLVIDDSLTSRMLEKGILESAGYEVDTAISGEEALECARRKQYALFLVDVEMPGMDGFTFVETARADPLLRDIPAIFVTSRAAPEDRQRGRDVGAQGYIVKSTFDQAELLTMIRPLMG